MLERTRKRESILSVVRNKGPFTNLVISLCIPGTLHEFLIVFFRFFFFPPIGMSFPRRLILAVFRIFVSLNYIKHFGF